MDLSNETENLRSLGSRIKYYRNRKEFTLKNLSDGSGVSMSVLSRLENDIIRKTNQFNLQKIAGALNIPVGLLTPAWLELTHFTVRICTEKAENFEGLLLKERFSEGYVIDFLEKWVNFSMVMDENKNISMALIDSKHLCTAPSSIIPICYISKDLVFIGWSKYCNEFFKTDMRFYRFFLTFWELIKEVNLQKNGEELFLHFTPDFVLYNK